MTDRKVTTGKYKPGWFIFSPTLQILLDGEHLGLLAWDKAAGWYYKERSRMSREPATHNFFVIGEKMAKKEYPNGKARE